MENNYLKEIAKESKEKLTNGNVAEMGSVIYDTLFQNKHFPQLKLNNLTPLPDSVYGDEQEVNTTTGVIRFGYLGHVYKVDITMEV